MRFTRLTRRPLAALAAGLAAGLVLLASGCGTTQFAYNRLDWLLDREISRYTELSDAQQGLVDRAFGSLWAWHRHDQLPRYARDLRELSAKVDQPLAEAEIDHYYRRMNAAWDRALGKLVPQGCTVLRTLSDEQVAEVLEEADEGLERYARKSVRPAETRLRANSERVLLRHLRRWIGPLLQGQRALVHEWARTRPLANTAWYEHRKAWRAAFGEALAARARPEFCGRLDQLVRRPSELWTPEVRQRIELNERVWIQTLAALGTTLDERQRLTLQQRLQTMARDFEELSREGG